MGDGGELERTLDDMYDHVAKSELRQNFSKVAKILRLSEKNSKTNAAKLWRNFFASFCVCLVL